MYKYGEVLSEHTKCLLLNYYEWALADTEREISENFPLTGGIKGSGVKAYLDYLQMFNHKDKLEIARVRVRKAHKKALEQCGESFSVSENLISEKFHTFFMTRAIKSIDVWPIPDKNKIDTKLLSKLIKENLIKICGDIQGHSKRSEWFHKTKIKGWEIMTWVNLRRTGQQIRYNHMIAKENDPDQYVILMDVMRWMGVTATEWNELEQGDEEIACEQLTALCKHFMNALPLILPHDK